MSGRGQAPSRATSSTCRRGRARADAWPRIAKGPQGGADHPDSRPAEWAPGQEHVRHVPYSSAPDLFSHRMQISGGALLFWRGSRDRKRNNPLRPRAHSPVVPKLTDAVALPAAPDLAATAAAWLQHLAHERRLSARTIEAYGRDARQFLAFLTERFGAPPSIADFTDCAPGDLRAFLARRRADGVEGRSLQRALSALKSLARHIARESGQTAAALGDRKSVV